MKYFNNNVYNKDFLSLFFKYDLKLNVIKNKQNNQYQKRRIFV